MSLSYCLKSDSATSQLFNQNGCDFDGDVMGDDYVLKATA